jgi:hypothetical protein
MSYEDASEEDGPEVEFAYEYSEGIVIEAGAEVYVRGTNGRLLGIGIFLGGLVLHEPDGTKVVRPIMEVQDKVVSGGQVDLWSPDPRLIEKHRHEPVYPIVDYLDEIKQFEARIRAMEDVAFSAEMGIGWTE